MYTSHTAKGKNARSGTHVIEKIYSALKALGPDWHTRSELVRALGKQQLNPSDRGALEQLANAGRIEVREVDAVHTNLLKRVEYRITQEANEQIVRPSGKAKA